MNDHRFIDEAGDTTFYGKGKVNIIGTEGVSLAFIIGMVKVQEEVKALNQRIEEFAKSVSENPLYSTISSVQKRMQQGSFYFHAKDDHPEVRAEFFKFISTLDCSFQAVVGRKETSRFVTQHQSKESLFYGDLLSHLLKDKLKSEGKLILNIASRHNSTGYNNLQEALELAKTRFLKKNQSDEIQTKVSFNVQPYTKEPILSVADYYCWAVQRVFEKGETRFYNFLLPKIKLVLDLWDKEKYEGSKNYYRGKNILTEQNQIKKPSLP